ncbi:hypothetical protein [Nonomuraea sp. B19D2]|uniref:hypothetical protein n=1 Tax=Nonomuraea sp. B19D2 TaxID=3159561 RepID=UPI0032DA402E
MGVEAQRVSGLDADLIAAFLAVVPDPVNIVSAIRPRSAYRLNRVSAMGPNVGATRTRARSSAMK